jgi:hypothetical protein
MISIETLGFLCSFGKKHSKQSHVNEEIEPYLTRYLSLRAHFQELQPAEPFFLQCADRKTFLVANAALERI